MKTQSMNPTTTTTVELTRAELWGLIDVLYEDGKWNIPTRRAGQKLLEAWHVRGSGCCAYTDTHPR